MNTTQCIYCISTCINYIEINSKILWSFTWESYLFLVRRNSHSIWSCRAFRIRNFIGPSIGNGVGMITVVIITIRICSIYPTTTKRCSTSSFLKYKHPEIWCNIKISTWYFKKNCRLCCISIPISILIYRIISCLS